jgi:hypothetical protein
VAAKFMADLGILFYDKLDTQGHIVERIEKFYPLPPVGQCNQTTFGDFKDSLLAMNLVPLTELRFSGSDALQCCDFFSNGEGYQFTVCDKGVGVYILNDKKGSALDLQFLNMPLAQVGFNDLPWEQLYQAVDNYCA